VRAAAELAVCRVLTQRERGRILANLPRPSNVTREQLANVLRAASRIAEVRDVVVIGSQSVAKRSPLR